MTQSDPQRQQQQQQQPFSEAPPTLHDIEVKHSQLPPQYRQAVLEQQQREHQQRLLQQQQQQQNSPKPDSPQKVALPSSSVSSSTNGTQTRQEGVNVSHQRISSAPLMNASPSTTSSNRSIRNGAVSPSSTGAGPSRAHWKPDSSTQVCTWPGCLREFGFFDRRHHCRKCGDIFCSVHCTKAIPLDSALDFNPAMGVMSRACTGCFEAYEQWQGLIPTSSSSTGTTTFTSQHTVRGAFGHVSDGHLPGEHPPNGAASGTNKSSGVLSSATTRKNTGHIPEGLLDQPGVASGEALGREDIVRSKPATDNIAIKTRPVQETAVMPMPSVPHDWSWSTF
ncbi:hypothetical protein BG011_000932 [Mortierella polycephala]|uniref:FYVE-type domain-containing protein n=1 Tax=Mortierella polycephala TaxID=41804 RepID=A0A9P6QAL6_9FUNG|nr:hypothetical protein BG011_000932 [Mortierella polycephala]